MDFALRNASTSVEQLYSGVAAYDLYLPANDRALLNLSFATSAVDSEGLLICDVVVTSAGDHLPCAADHLSMKKFQIFNSDAWTNVTVDLKIIENIAASGATKTPDNKVR